VMTVLPSSADWKNAQSDFESAVSAYESECR
jgi:hypothetical protein